MSDTVDTRVVEAKFDAEDFEKGVDKTIKKLDELKKSLNMKDSGKSVTEFSKITSEATEKANSSLEKLTNRLTTFTGMLKNQLISGLASEVSGAFLKMEQSITGFFNTITSQSVSAGMNKYTEILNSVRTMTAAGESQANAYKAIERLALYSDQTSYSLSQMTSAMSKMVAAGANLEDAEKSVEGLANMAAAAGVNIYDANRAFLNFTQAYSSGSMRIQDWMSFESLNMATAKTMEIFQEAGVQAGTLTKTVKKNAKNVEEIVYKTTNKVNKKIQSGKDVSQKGFRDTLRYGWLDRDTMNIATSVLSYFEDLGVDFEKLSEEDMKKFSAQAYQAAKEARSFADVMGTLRDVLQTGWATTFENIFGPLDKATKFFTWLADSNILDIFYKLSEYRNAILERWNENTAGGKNGSDLFLEAIQNIDEAIGSVTEKIRALFPDTEHLGDWLFQKTGEFQRATASLVEWLNTAADGETETRAEKIANIFSIVGTAISVAARLIGTAVKSIDIVVKAFSPIIDAVISTLSKFGKSLSDTNKETSIFDDLANSVQNIMIAAEPLLKVLPPIIEFLGLIGQFFLDTAISTMTMNVQLFSDALGFLIELFGGKSAQKATDPNNGVIDRIKKSILDMKVAIDMTLGAAREFFGNLITDLKVLLGIGEVAEGEEGGFFSNVANFFKTNKFIEDAKAWIDQAVIDVGAFIKDIPNRLNQYAINIGSFIHGLFYNEVDVNALNGNETGVQSFEVETPLKQWLDGTLEKIRNFIASIPTRIEGLANEVGSIIGTVLESIVTYFLGPEKIVTTIEPDSEEGWVQVEKVVRDNVNRGIDDTTNSIKSFIKSIPERVANGLKKVGSILKSFWEGLFYTRTDKEIKRGPDTLLKENAQLVERPLKKWIDQTVQKIAAFIKKIPEYVRNGIRGVGTVVGNLISALFGKKDGEEPTSKDVEDAVMKPFTNISFNGVLGKIKEIGTSLGNWVISIFTGTDDLEKNQDIFATTIANGIQWIKDKAVESWNKISEWFVNLPLKIAEFFNLIRIQKAINNEAKDSGPIEKAVTDFANTIGGFILGLPDQLLTFFDNSIKGISALWNRLYDALTGNSPEAKDQRELLSNGQGGYTNEAYRLANILNESAPDPGNVEVSKWKTFTEHLGQTISNLFAQIPTFIAQGIDLAIKGIDWAINGITSWFKMGGVEKKIADESKKTGEQIMSDIGESTEAGAEKETGSGLLVALGNIGQSITKLIKETIPGFLTTGWNYVRDNAGNWWEAFKTIFDGFNTEDLREKVNSIGETIEGFIHNIPTYITRGVRWVKQLINGKPTVKQITNSLVWDTDALQAQMHSALKDSGEVTKKQISNAPLWDETTGTFKKRLNETSEELADTTSNEGIWGVIKEIGKSIMDAFAQLGPYVVKGINSAMQWINNGFVWLTNFFKKRNKEEPITKSLADAVEGENGEYRVLAQGVQELGTTMSTMISDTLPGFIEAGSEEVIHKIPSLWDRIINALLPSASAAELSVDAKNINPLTEQLENGFGMPDENASEDAGSKAEGAKTAMQSLGDLMTTIGNVVTSPAVGQIALIAVVGYALSQVKDIFSLADELEAVTYGVAFAGIGVALAGIAAIIAQCVYIASKNDTDQLNSVTDMLDKVGDFFTKIMSQVKWIVGLYAGGKLFGAVGDIAEAFANVKTGGLKQVGKSIAGNAAGSLGAGLIAGGIGFGMAGIIESFLSDFMAPFNSLANGLETFVSTAKPLLEDISSMTSDLTNAMKFPELFNQFIAEMTSIFKNEEGNYGQGELGLGDDPFEYIQNIVQNNGVPIGEYVRNLDVYYHYLLGASTFLSNISRALKEFDTIEDPSATLAMATSLLGEDGPFGPFLQAMHSAMVRWIEPYGAEILKGTSIELEYLGNALSIFSGGISGMSEDNVQALSRSLDVFEKLALALTEGADENILEKISTGKADITKFGSQVQQFGGNMKIFFDKIKSVTITDDTDMQRLKLKTELMIAVVKGFAEAAGNAFNSIAVDALDSLVNKMENIGEDLAKFMNTVYTTLSPDMKQTDYDGIKTTVEVFGMLTDAIYNLDKVNISSTATKFSEFIKAMFGVEGNSETPLIDQLNEFTALLNESVLNEMELTPTIRPVVEMDNVDAAFEQYFGSNWKFHFDPGTVSAQMANPANTSYGTVINAQTDISSITTKLDSTNRYLAGILEKNPIYSVYMDSGVLVGQMGPAMYNYISSQLVREGRR